MRFASGLLTYAHTYTCITTYVYVHMCAHTGIHMYTHQKVRRSSSLQNEAFTLFPKTAYRFNIKVELNTFDDNPYEQNFTKD